MPEKNTIQKPGRNKGREWINENSHMTSYVRWSCSGQGYNFAIKDCGSHEVSIHDGAHSNDKARRFKRGLKKMKLIERELKLMIENLKYQIELAKDDEGGDDDEY